ncbi:uncharacterized protein GGS22DRAFT_99463 [Annulohypoxylon maeteangense]|uniref:uncharacterized protein n=1 Tax=Annulohypoxylon maeteangense TaxID=1927788 RepID=UPI0020089B0C|nr:uncharacterized protein GGS22DRAFT_99463 [Annulohypoxylon maeteangense]KAI0880206.1 hypothetical protein GGS22DRAFT_99463 [Annulohypoxylon maeteangense]
MTSAEVDDSCIVCNTSNARFCDRCKDTRYCSKACQRVDWPTHKLLCTAFSKFDITKRPSKDHLRAIFFPVDKEKPELIWLHCPWRDDEEDGWYQHPDKKPFLGADTFPSTTSIQRNKILERNLSHTIDVCYRDGFLVDGSSANKSIGSITSTKPYQSHDWRGPVLAYGKKGLGIDQIACDDLGMNDFRHVADFFISYGLDPVSFDRQFVGEKIKGIRINCIGDQRMCGRPKFEVVEITPTDPIFLINDVSQIMKRVELPIITRRCLPDQRWANNKNYGPFEGIDPFTNQEATYLHLCCDPKGDVDLATGKLGWGFAPLQWQNSVGSVIVARQDKKPLFPLHMEAMCKYCRYEANDLFRHSSGEFAPEKPIAKSDVLTMICRPAFVIFWYKMLEERREKGQDANTPYPYYDMHV